MDPFPPNTSPLPPALRALALGLLVETVVPMLHRSRADRPVPTGPGDRDADGTAELWQDLRGKCSELSALVLRADNPREAAAYVLGYLPKHFDYIFELFYSQKRRQLLGAFEPAGPFAMQEGRLDGEPA
jgi:hypothetical protein